MPRHRYHMTRTARDHLKDAVRATKQKWGSAQARKYSVDFQAVLQSLAKNHIMLRATFRHVMTQGTLFRVHRIEHRYVVFQEHDLYNLIIVGIFHEKMDVPARIQELAMMTNYEIDAIKNMISNNP
jgi:toxin ParE1/3/4